MAAGLISTPLFYPFLFVDTMGRHRIRVKITAGKANSRDMLAWIEAFAAHHRTDTGEQAWTVSNRDEPEPLGDFGPLHKAEIELTQA